MNKIKSIKQTCFACPSQFEGYTDDNRYVYVRYRWGHLSIDINDIEVLSESFGDSMDGVLSYEELKEKTKENFEWPENCE